MRGSTRHTCARRPHCGMPRGELCHVLILALAIAVLVLLLLALGFLLGFGFGRAWEAGCCVEHPHDRSPWRFW